MTSTDWNARDRTYEMAGRPSQLDALDVMSNSTLAMEAVTVVALPALAHSDADLPTTATANAFGHGRQGEMSPFLSSQELLMSPNDLRCRSLLKKSMGMHSQPPPPRTTATSHCTMQVPYRELLVQAGIVASTKPLAVCIAATRRGISVRTVIEHT